MKHEDLHPKIDVFFWSSTGNTAYAASLAAGALEETGASVTVTDIRDLRSPEAPGDTDLLVVAAPVYDFRPAIPVEDFISGLRDLGGTKVAAIFTCAGYSDRAPTAFASMIRGKNGVPWDYVELICEDSWPIARRYLTFIASWGEPSPDRVALFEAWWRAVPGRLADGDAGSSWWRPPTPLSLCSLLYDRRLLRRFFRIVVDLDRCNRCGKCVERCPTGRMKIEEFPEPSGDCVGCYGCVNVCPLEAVNSWLTRGAPRYKGIAAGTSGTNLPGTDRAACVSPVSEVRADKEDSPPQDRVMPREDTGGNATGENVKKFDGN